MADSAPRSPMPAPDAGPVAVMLAAGAGSRLRTAVGERPKALIEVGGRTLLARSLDRLREAGVRELTVVVGYRRALLEDALEELWPGARTVVNPDFETTGSMRSLALAFDALTDDDAGPARDILVLESDLLYEGRALSAILRDAERDLVLVSGPTGAGDEVWVCGTEGRVRELAKSPSGAWPRRGELVGLTRLAPDTLARMAGSHRAAGDEAGCEHYEERLSTLAGELELWYRRVDDLVWGEIDHEGHLERVRDVVLPRLERPTSPGANARPLLLTPGPANTSEAVKQAQMATDVCPREAAFEAVVAGVREKLVRVLGGGRGWTAIPLPGSGTAAVEAALLTFSGRESRVLVLENGAYGRRAARMLRVHRIDHEVLRTPWWEPLDPSIVDDSLEADHDFSHLFVVHHETTAGVLNPLARLTGAARRRGLTTVVDAMSSFGGVPLDDALDGLDVVISSANKCVQGVPGLGFVLSRTTALDRARGGRPRSVALDLAHAHDHLEDTGQFPFTPPVTVVYALDAALDELLAEGVQARRDRYDACYRILARTVEGLGLEYLVEPAHHSRLVTAVLEPEEPGFSYGALHDGLLERGVTIYPGKVPERPSFRLGSMGDLVPADMERAMEALTEVMTELGAVPRAEASR